GRRRDGLAGGSHRQVLHRHRGGTRAHFTLREGGGDGGGQERADAGGGNGARGSEDVRHGEFLRGAHGVHLATAALATAWLTAAGIPGMAAAAPGIERLGTLMLIGGAAPPPPLPPTMYSTRSEGRPPSSPWPGGRGRPTPSRWAVFTTRTRAGLLSCGLRS